MELRRLLFERSLTQREVLRAMPDDDRLAPPLMSTFVNRRRELWPKARRQIRAALAALGVPQAEIDQVPELAGGKDRAVTEAPR